MSKRKVSVEDKIYAVNLYLDGKESQHQIAAMFDVCIASVQQWIRNYDHGCRCIHIKGKQEIFQRIETASGFGLFSRRGSKMIFVKDTEFVQKLSYKSG